MLQQLQDMRASPDELQKAHKLFLAAAANRDERPDIYEGARIRYNTLKNGEGWLQQEKSRVSDQKLKPKIDEYRQQYQTLNSEYSAQRGLVDSIADVRDRQSALAGSASSSMSVLNDILRDKEAKMSVYDRFVELVAPNAYIQQETSGEGPAAIPIVAYFASFPSSFTIILDVSIAVLGLFLFVILLNKSGVSFRGFANLTGRSWGWGAPAYGLRSPLSSTSAPLSTT